MNFVWTTEWLLVRTSYLVAECLSCLLVRKRTYRCANAYRLASYITNSAHDVRVKVLLCQV